MYIRFEVKFPKDDNSHGIMNCTNILLNAQSLLDKAPEEISSKAVVLKERMKLIEGKTRSHFASYMDKLNKDLPDPLIKNPSLAPIFKLYYTESLFTEYGVYRFSDILFKLMKEYKKIGAEIIQINIKDDEIDPRSIIYRDIFQIVRII